MMFQRKEQAPGRAAATLVHNCEWREKARRLQDRMQDFRKEVAFEDPETGLGNPMQLRRDARKAFAHVRRAGGTFALVLLDVQTSRGEATLPFEVVESVAAMLRDSAREEDSIAQIGPCTFAALLSGADEYGARQFAERVSRALAGATVHYDGRPAFLTGSMGVAAYEEWMHGAEALVDAARDDMSGYRRAVGLHRAAFAGS